MQISHKSFLYIIYFTQIFLRDSILLDLLSFIISYLPIHKSPRLNSIILLISSINSCGIILRLSAVVLSN